MEIGRIIKMATCKEKTTDLEGKKVALFGFRNKLHLTRGNAWTGMINGIGWGTVAVAPRSAFHRHVVNEWCDTFNRSFHAWYCVRQGCATFCSSLVGFLIRNVLI